MRRYICIMPEKDIRIVYAGFFAAIVVGFIVVINFAHDAMVVYPETKKLDQLIDSKSEYGDALKYVKIKGPVTTLYKTRYGIYFSIKPTVFEYNSDSIAGKKVFYIKKHDTNVWFCLRGRDQYDLPRLKKGDTLKTDFGEPEFTGVKQSGRATHPGVKAVIPWGH
jgi:hypothetical protein